MPFGIKKKGDMQNMSNVCGQKSNDHNKEKITTDPYSNMNTEDESTKNNTVTKLVLLRSIGGTHTSNTASIKNKDLDRVWLEHFARAIYKNGLLNDRQYKKLLSMIDRELVRMYHKAA